MAFRTNKVPVLQERTVSGSSVSFNSAFALPLKACKVSFSATQAGSGDPSPSNPRAISGVSAIGSTANSIPISVSLGDTRYGGELDVLTGELTLNKWYVQAKDLSTNYIFWVYYPALNGVYFPFDNGTYNFIDISTSETYPDGKHPVMCNVYRYPSAPVEPTDENYIRWLGNTNNGNLLFKNEHTTSYNDWLSYIANADIQLVFDIHEQTIQLSPTELSSILGNNTFSTDTGTLEITFADLQEKSASGSVATFNTALAMPLASCNIAVNAWQEGSGDPSPVNKRTIHGYSEVNATRAGKNLLDKRLLIQSPAVSQPFLCKIGADSFSSNIPNGSIVLASGQYTFSCIYKNDSSKNNTQLSVYDENGNNLYTRYTVQSIKFTVPKSMAVCFYINCGASGFTSWDDYDIQLEVGSEATAYEPYVTSTIYTIQLGQEVYGAEVDVVSGVAHVTHYIPDLSNATIRSGNKATGYTGIYFYLAASSVRQLPPCKYSVSQTQPIKDSEMFNQGVIVNPYTYDGNSAWAYKEDTGTNIRFTFTDIQTIEDFEAIKSSLKVVYELETPFDIQLTPTQIETLIGNNTIFADTGDIDLTYKDLDIAKRGSFREVFKLPS